jgi:hypothetical protein
MLPPVALHVTPASAALHSSLAVNCCAPPWGSVTETGPTLTTTSGTVAVADPVTVGSSRLVATIRNTVRVCGAVYWPLWSIAPASIPAAGAETDHRTRVVGAPVTVAVNVCGAPGASATALGESVTVPEGGGGRASRPFVPPLPPSPCPLPPSVSWVLASSPPAEPSSPQGAPAAPPWPRALYWQPDTAPAPNAERPSARAIVQGDSARRRCIAQTATTARTGEESATSPLRSFTDGRTWNARVGSRA